MARVLWPRITDPRAPAGYHPHHRPLGRHRGRLQKLGQVARLVQRDFRRSWKYSGRFRYLKSSPLRHLEGKSSSVRLTRKSSFFLDLSSFNATRKLSLSPPRGGICTVISVSARVQCFFIPFLSFDSYHSVFLKGFTPTLLPHSPIANVPIRQPRQRQKPAASNGVSGFKGEVLVCRIGNFN